jgi:hypothetical protein
LQLGLALTAPHWAANWAWYGDPVYPVLHAHLRDGSWAPGAIRRLDTFYAADAWAPHGPLGSKIIQALRALVTFSIEPHDWPTYHGRVPVFGPLFTMLSLLVPFLRRVRRTAALVGCALVGMVIWFWTSHQDRYLQCLLPWMATATAAIAYLAWAQLPRLRPALLLAFGLSIVWGGDVYFMHAKDDCYEVDRPSPIKSAVDLLSAGHRGEYSERLHPFATWEKIGASLPSTAKVLLHERYLHLGLARRSVSDLPGWQGRISYEDLLTSKAILERLRELGVSHVLWETETSHESDSFRGDLAFFRFVSEATEDARSFGPFTVAALTANGGSSDPGLFAWYDCPAPGEPRPLGATAVPGELGALASLDADDPETTPVAPLERDGSPPEAASLLVVNRDCHDAFRAGDWRFAANRGRYALWVRAAHGGNWDDAPSRRTSSAVRLAR